MKIYDCAIVGGGPGGLIAAVYLKRFNREVVLFDCQESRTQYIPKIRNLIGYDTGISGKRLLSKLKRQALKYNTEVINERATVYRNGKIFELKAGNRRFRARKIILATGMKDNQPKIKNYWDLCEKGVLGYCPICDGFEQTKQKIGLIVEGTTCFKKAKFLSGYTRNLHIIATKKFPLAPIHKAFIKKNKIQMHWGEIEKLSFHEKNRSLVVRLKNKKPFQLKMAYVSLGVTVDKSGFKHIYDLGRNSDGFIKVSSHQETSIPGIYAVGDCVYSLSQVSVAVGQAAIAATRVHNALNKTKSFL